eukprot:3427113-Pyramimonas_sp.AAC.1
MEHGGMEHGGGTTQKRSRTRGPALHSTAYMQLSIQSGKKFMRQFCILLVRKLSDKTSHIASWPRPPRLIAALEYQRCHDRRTTTT